MTLFSCISFLQKHTKNDVCVIKTFRGDNVIDIVLMIKAYDLQMKLGIKNISDLVRKKIMGRVVLKSQQSKNIVIIKHIKNNGVVIVITHITNDIASPIIMYCGTVAADRFRIDLGLNSIDVVMTKEQSVMIKIMESFPGV